MRKQRGKEAESHGPAAIARPLNRRTSAAATRQAIHRCRTHHSPTRGLSTQPATLRMVRRAHRHWRRISERTRAALAWAGIPENLGTLKSDRRATR